MSKKSNPTAVSPRTYVQDIAAIKNCLDYLETEALQANLTLAAHFIGAAAMATQDSLNVVARVRSATPPSPNPTGRNKRR